MKILFLTTILPFKAKSGGEIVSKLFIDNLESLGHSVHVLGYLRKGDTSKDIPENMYLVKKIVIESNSSKLFTIVNLIKSFIKGLCYSSQKYITKEYIRCIKKLLIQDSYEYIIIDHFQMGWILKHLPSNIKIASIAHNVESDLYEQLSQNTNTIFSYIYKQEARKMRVLEDKLIKISQRVWTLTQDNQKRYIELFAVSNEKLKVICIPPVEIPDILLSTNNTKWDIGIIGTWTWKANMDGLVWFFDEVYPLLRSTITISVAGLGAEFLQGKYKNVSYLGFVESANSFMTESKVIAIPSITGDGIQIKTIQAISLGLNIVASTFALRGIDNLPSYVQEARNPEEFREGLMFTIESQKEHKEEASKWNNNRKKQFIEDINII